MTTIDQVLDSLGYEGTRIEKFKNILDDLGIKLMTFFEGTEFGATPYTADDKKLILNDLQGLLFEKFTTPTPAAGLRPVYIASVGAPGTGKSYFLESSYVGKIDAIYIDPDRVSLPAMQGYIADRAINQPAAYIKWRNGSNFIAYFMLTEALSRGLSIIHGTTSSNPIMKQIYQSLRANDYMIRLDLLFTEAEHRNQALDYRARSENGVTVSVEDARGKAKPIFERLLDAYYLADQINVYRQLNGFWSSKGSIRPELMAVYSSLSGTNFLYPQYSNPDLAEFIYKLMTEEGCDLSLQSGVSKFHKSPINKPSIKPELTIYKVHRVIPANSFDPSYEEYMKAEGRKAGL